MPASTPTAMKVKGLKKFFGTCANFWPVVRGAVFVSRPSTTREFGRSRLKGPLRFVFDESVCPDFPALDGSELCAINGAQRRGTNRAQSRRAGSIRAV